MRRDGPGWGGVAHTAQAQVALGRRGPRPTQRRLAQGGAGLWIGRAWGGGHHLRGGGLREAGFGGSHLQGGGSERGGVL